MLVPQTVECRICKLPKLVGFDFYARYGLVCKTCARNRAKKTRQKNIMHYREYDKKRRSTEEFLARRRENYRKKKENKCN